MHAVASTFNGAELREIMVGTRASYCNEILEQSSSGALVTGMRILHPRKKEPFYEMERHSGSNGLRC